MTAPYVIDALLRFVASAPAGPALATRTILISSEAEAHDLRRVLAARAPRALIGTRFVRPEAAALELLHREGLELRAGEEDLRATRLLVLFRERTLSLQYFSPALLAEAPGWDVAFARTLTELEGAGLSPRELEDIAARTPSDGAAAHGAARLRDLALVWRAVDKRAAESITGPRALREAAKLLSRAPASWPEAGPTLAFVTGHESVALAQFVRAIPRASLTLLPSRPRRRAHLERVARLFPALKAVTPNHQEETGELDILARYLFESPEVLSAPDRARSRGDDGSVAFEQTGGVAEELEATAQWVQREVQEHGTPLAEIAILVPRLDPWATLVRDRLATLPWPESTNRGDDEDGERENAAPVVVLGGVPVSRTTAGARLRAVLEGLAGYLPMDALAALVPCLRAVGLEGRTRLGRRQSIELVTKMGLVGGAPAAPNGALEWLPRVEEQIRVLERELREARETGITEDEDRSPALRAAARRLAALSAIVPALTALDAVARRVVAEEPLSHVWPLLEDFLREHVVLPPPHGASLLGALGASVTTLLATEAGAVMRATEALGILQGSLEGVRAKVARFGEPAITITTVRRAANLTFRAVRIVGLVEGVMPSPGREDPVLPDALRRELPGMARLGDRAHADLSSLVRVLEATGKRVALSASIVDVDGTSRDLSPIFTEAGAALVRPAREVTSTRAEPFVPGARLLRERYFRPARDALAAFERAHPLREASWHGVAARSERKVPAHWGGPGAVALDRLFALSEPERPGDALDGIFPKRGAFPELPGLTPGAPISPTRLGSALACPYQFFLTNALGWSEVKDAPDGNEVDPMSYGSLFHKVAEDFYRAHGAEFVRRKSSLADHLTVAIKMATEAFDAFARGYPLGGDAIYVAQRERLVRDVVTLLEYDWDSEAHQYVDVERSFGEDEPVVIEIAKGPVYLRGQIDRIDLMQGRSTAFVRDLKTGKPKLRKEGDPFDVAIDLQLGVYALVAETMAKKWKLSVSGGIEVAYVYPKGYPYLERRFDAEETAALMHRTREWIGVVRSLFASRTLPRTVDAKTCEYCAFQVACTRERGGRAAAVLEDERRAKPYLKLLQGEGDE